MDFIKHYLETLTIDEITKLRKKMYQTILFTRNKQYAELLGLLDVEMMHYLVSRTQQSPKCER